MSYKNLKEKIKEVKNTKKIVIALLSIIIVVSLGTFSILKIKQRNEMLAKLEVQDEEASEKADEDNLITEKPEEIEDKVETEDKEETEEKVGENIDNSSSTEPNNEEVKPDENKENTTVGNESNNISSGTTVNPNPVPQPKPETPKPQPTPPPAPANKPAGYDASLSTKALTIFNNLQYNYTGFEEDRLIGAVRDKLINGAPTPQWLIDGITDNVNGNFYKYKGEKRGTAKGKESELEDLIIVAWRNSLNGNMESMNVKYPRVDQNGDGTITVTVLKVTII